VRGIETHVKKKILLFPVYVIHYWLVLWNKIFEFLHIMVYVSEFLKVIVRAIIYSIVKLVHGVVVEGKENLPKKGPLIIACNHQSYLDPPLIGTVGPRDLTFVSKIENFLIPILGPLIELGGVVRINRRGGEGVLDAIEKVLRGGSKIVFYPEGTIPGEEALGRSSIQRETGLLRGHTGVMRLALATGAVIVPCGISGTSNALPPEAIPNGKMFPMLRFGKRIKIKFGKPISYESCNLNEVSKEKVRELTDRLMEEIAKLVDTSMSFPPINVPVTDEDYKKIAEFEKYWGIGPARGEKFAKS
jgi:1-acyl-sn-glycerol-3-phosphate acyltransferase